MSLDIWTYNNITVQKAWNIGVQMENTSFKYFMYALWIKYNLNKESKMKSEIQDHSQIGTAQKIYLKASRFAGGCSLHLHQWGPSGPTKGLGPFFESFWEQLTSIDIILKGRIFQDAPKA